MRSDDAWYAAHGATAGVVTTAGTVLVIAAATVLLLRPTDETTILTIVLGGAGVSLGLVLAAGAHGHRIATRINRGTGGDCPHGDQGTT